MTQVWYYGSSTTGLVLRVWYCALLAHLYFALCWCAQESAVANMDQLDQLLSWVQRRKGGKEVVRQAIEALRELFLTVLLPDRKLKFLTQQPLQVGGRRGGGMRELHAPLVVDLAVAIGLR